MRIVGILLPISLIAFLVWCYATKPKSTKLPDSTLDKWGYVRKGDTIVIRDDRLTVHTDGQVTDANGDYVGRVELKP